MIALSPPLTFSGVNAEKAAPSLRAPALYVAGDDDGDYEVYARQINQATPADLRNLVVVSAPQHGIQFVAADTPEAAEVRAEIEAFLAERLRPAPSGSAHAPLIHSRMRRRRRGRRSAFKITWGSCDLADGADPRRRMVLGWALGCLRRAQAMIVCRTGRYAPGWARTPSKPEGDRHRECRGCAGE